MVLRVREWGGTHQAARARRWVLDWSRADCRRRRRCVACPAGVRGRCRGAPWAQARGGGQQPQARGARLEDEQGCVGEGGWGVGGGAWRACVVRAPSLRTPLCLPADPPSPLPPPPPLLRAGEVSPSVAAKLLQLCQALDVGDFVTATHMQVLAAQPRSVAGQPTPALVCALGCVRALACPCGACSLSPCA